MAKRNNNNIERTEEWLDERYGIYCNLSRNEDLLYYKGALMAIEMMGYAWERNNSGKHILYKN